MARPPSTRITATSFARTNASFLASREGKALVGNAIAARTQIPDQPNSAEKMGAAALKWVERMPDTLVKTDQITLPSYDQMTGPALAREVASSMSLLESVGTALLGGAAMDKDFAVDKLLHSAFGGDKAAISIRRPFGPNTDIDWPEIPGLDPKKLQEILIQGALREVFQTMARCGAGAKANRAPPTQLSGRIGEVTGIDAKKGRCPGNTITIHYADFHRHFNGTNPPNFAVGDRLVVAFNNTWGFRDFVVLEPGKFPGWPDSGSIGVTLPDWIASGGVCFFILPAPRHSGCEPGSLMNAVGQLQSHLAAAGFGAAAFGMTQNLMNHATMAEASGSAPTDLTSGAKPGDPDWLDAGAPKIHSFTSHETGPVHPRRTITLSWHVENATRIEVFAVDKAGSEHPHELPPIGVVTDKKGKFALSVPCTTNWGGAYILRATNATNCTPFPAEARIEFDSHYSEYLVGTARQPILLPNDGAGLPMAGFADEMQIATGPRPITLPGATSAIPEQICARAFAIQENRLGGDASRIIYIVADIWTCTQALKAAVAARLQIDTSRLMISGTHTHAVPGGYSHYHLYNFTTGGFRQPVFDVIVDAMVAAARRAVTGLVPGFVSFGMGTVSNCGVNRSAAAASLNPEVSNGSVPDVDSSMPLLRFDWLRDYQGETRPLGLLNWYGIHPTGLGYMNTLVSGDCKGWAALCFEAEMASVYPHFVAGFATSNAGDISGNYRLDAYGVRVNVVPLGSPVNQTLLAADIAAMESIGDTQHLAARVAYDALENDKSKRLSGPLKAVHDHVDFSGLLIASTPGARTWSAALGISFGAGSVEDGEAAIYISLPSVFPVSTEWGDGTVQITTNPSRPTLKIQSKIIEGMTFAAHMIGGVEAGPIGLPLVTSIPLLTIWLPRLAKMQKGNASSFLFGLAGKMMFGERINPPKGDSQHSWEWKLPDDVFIRPFMIVGHLEKPIMFQVGLSELERTDANGTKQTFACPLVPHVLPLQILAIGPLAILGAPAELTSVAGRRLQSMVAATLAIAPSSVIISNYANGYASYVTTREEYSAQHYEGASTLYGPHTLAAFIQEFDRLAADMRAGRAVVSRPAFQVPAVYRS